MTRTKPESAQLIYNDDGALAMVRGTDASAILAEAKEFAAGEWMAVVDGLDDVKVRTIRANPCHESSCWDGGGHTCHYAYGGGRGSFSGAFVALRDLNDEELKAHRTTREDTVPHEH